VGGGGGGGGGGPIEVLLQGHDKDTDPMFTPQSIMKSHSLQMDLSFFLGFI